MQLPEDLDLYQFLQKKRPVRNHSIDSILGVSTDGHCHPYGATPIKDMTFFQLRDIITTYDECRQSSTTYLQPNRDNNEVDFLLDELSRRVVGVIETTNNQYKTSVGLEYAIFKNNLAALNKAISQSEFLASHEGMKNLLQFGSDLLDNIISIDDILGVDPGDLLASERRNSFMVNHNRESHCHPYGHIPIKNMHFFQLWNIIANYDGDRERSKVYVQCDRDKNAVNVLLDRLSQQGLSVLGKKNTPSRGELATFTNAISVSTFLSPHPGMKELLNAGINLWQAMCEKSKDYYDEEISSPAVKRDEQRAFKMGGK
jgi:hypothetical protein